MLALAFVLMQFMISAKAGLVNYVDGQANVHLHEQVTVGKTIETGPRSHVELLLNPGSFFRIDENSSVVLDSAELTNIAVRIVSGGALLEAADVDKHTPIRVTTGSLTVLVISSGAYRFSGDTAAVLDGKLQTADSSMTVKKGHQITGNRDQYEETKIARNEPMDDLELWSRQRSSDLAKANTLAYNGKTGGTIYYPYGFSSGSLWMYSPFLGGFTFIPGRSYRSYWGYSFAPVVAFAPVIYTGLQGRPPIHRPSAPASTSTTSRAPSFRGVVGGFGGTHAGSAGRSGGGHGHR